MNSVEIGFEDFIKRIPPNATYYGEWNNDGTWRDFRRGNKIFEFDPLYGHRPRKSSALLHNRSHTERYLYVVDRDGFVPNTLKSEPALTRIKEARKNGSKVIFLFGGSTVFGTGSRIPDENISTFLERCLNSNDKYNSIVINAGGVGYTTDQQLRLLMYEIIPLKPDMVIFYDGWNDCSYLNGLISTYGDQYVQGRTKQSYLLLKRQEDFLDFVPIFKYSIGLGTRLILECFALIPYVGDKAFNILKIIFPKIFSHPFSADSPDNFFNLRSVDIYAYNIFLACTLCRAFGVEFLHFLQPLLSTGQKVLTDSEEILLDRNVSSDGDRDIYVHFYRHFEQRDFENAVRLKPVNTHSLKDVFQNVSEQVYVDTGHLNATGNYIVAQAMANTIK